MLRKIFEKISFFRKPFFQEKETEVPKIAKSPRLFVHEKNRFPHLKINTTNHIHNLAVRGFGQKSSVYPKEMLLPEEIEIKTNEILKSQGYHERSLSEELIQKIEDGYSLESDSVVALGIRQTLLTENYGRIRVPPTGLQLLILKCMNAYHKKRTNYDDCDGIREFLPSYLYHAISAKIQYIETHADSLASSDMMDLDCAILMDDADVISLWGNQQFHHDVCKTRDLFELKKIDLFESFDKRIEQGRRKRFLQTKIPLVSQEEYQDSNRLIRFFEEKSKKIHKKNAKAKSKELLQKLDSNQCKVRFALTKSGDHIYTDLFSRNEYGDFIHYSGMGDLIWDEDQEKKAMFHGDDLEWVELPAKKSPPKLIKKLQDKDLIYQNQFENELKLHWQRCGKNKRIPKHKDYFDSLVQSGYTELHAFFYAFVKDNNPNLFFDFSHHFLSTIDDIEAHLKKKDILDIDCFLDTQKALFSERYLHPRKLRPNLNYFTPNHDQLPCAATAKTIMDIAEYDFNAIRVSPLGPTNVAKYASEFGLEHLRKVTDDFRISGNFFQSESHDPDEVLAKEEKDLISLLIWRLELKQNDHDFFAKVFVSDKKIKLLKEKLGTREYLLSQSPAELICLIDDILKNPTMNGHFFDRNGGFTGARLREIRGRLLRLS